MMLKPIGFNRKATGGGGGGSFSATLVDVEDVGQVGSGASGGQATVTAAALGTADSDRVIYVWVFYETFDGAEITSLTVGGVSATEQTAYEHPTSPASGKQVRLFSAAVPTGTTGNIVIDTDAEGFGMIIEVIRTIDAQIDDHGYAETIDGEDITITVSSITRVAGGTLVGGVYANDGIQPQSFSTMSLGTFIDSANINDLQGASATSISGGTSDETATYSAGQDFPKFFGVLSFSEDLS